MNILSSLSELLNNEEIKNLLGLLTTQPQKTPTNAVAQTTHYYELPTYEQNSEPTYEKPPKEPQSLNLNLETIIKIASVLLQFLSTKNNKTEQKAPLLTNNNTPSKIEQLKRVE